jgi:uncharacterized Zn finger protein
MKSDEFLVTCSECGTEFKTTLDEEDLVNILEDSRDNSFYLGCNNCGRMPKYELVGFSIRVTPTKGDKA